MEENQLNLDAPFLSVRRVPDHSIQSDNTENKKTTKTKKLHQETKQETLIRLLKQDRSFDHVMEPSSVPFKWEQTPGKPKDVHKLIQEADQIKALEMVSSTASFSVNCSTSGVSDELEKSLSKDDVISEYRDLIMSRFLPDAKAMAFKETSIDEEKKMRKQKKKKQRIALERVSMAINQDLNNNDDDEDDNEDNHNLNVSKKAVYGFLPQFCSKNSLDVLNPILSRVKTCQDLGGKIVNPKPVYKPQAASSVPRVLRCNKGHQEIYPIPRALSKPSDIVRRNPTRLQRTTNDQIQRQGTRLLVEEVKRRSQRNKTRSLGSVPQPPLPKTPSESWLCRTLPKSAAVATVVSGQSARFKKMEQKTIKWETMVKTSYKHHDHSRYSEEHVGVHPTFQRKY